MPNTDKMILLPQLQRYDQNIKGWADNKFLTKVDTPSLPKATATTLGGVKVGNGLSVTDDGVLSAEDDIVFTWDFDTSAFSCNKTFAEVKKIITTGVRRTATANGIPEAFSITLLVGVANDNVVVFFGTTPTDALGSGTLGSKIYGTTTYLFQKGLVIMYTSDGHIQMTEDLSNLNTNMSFDFKNTTFQYDRNNSFDLKDGGITSTKLADGAVTAAKIADGAITADKLASGVGGGISISILTDIKKADSRNRIYIVHPDYPSVSFYLDVGYEKTSDISNFIYGQIDAGDYIGLCVIGIGYSGRDGVRSYSSGSIILCKTSTISNLNPTNIGLSGPGIANKISSLFRFTSTIYLDELNIIPKYNFIPKSASAQAALARLVPVQDECEQMAAEVAKIEQDWIDNPDDMVAVDGNGVPITIATKKTELEKKQAELEKLREDYFSKLGDWKNEVQE